MNEPLLKVRRISKRFANRWVLRDVSFSVRQGEMLGLIGPNGAGKTTLFECLAGLAPADAGVLTFRGELLPAANRQRALFYLPDGISPWAAQTVRWALSFFEQLYRPAQTSAAELAKELKLDHLLSSRVSSLSKGERKRLLLALGLLTPQPLLMLDEPFDGLDLRQTRDVMSLLRRHTEAGRTMLLSIHQLIDAARVCDRLVLLSEGNVVGEGTIDELRSYANLEIPHAGLEEIFLALT
ncbi:MAG TPA: ABC transporter ATP-binding protein [Blastocatellia bacterium]|nr:ABC transporter ATP-binding protein [Blastocatellia bacterium]